MRLPSPDDSSISGPNQEYPVNLQYSVSIQFEKVDEKLPQCRPIHSSVMHKRDHQQRDTAEDSSQNHFHPVSWSTPGRLNSPSFHLSHSRSSCSCASYMSNRRSTEQQHLLLNMPVVRTKSLDGHNGTVHSIYSSCASQSHKHHGEGQYSIACTAHVHVHVHLATCTCTCVCVCVCVCMYMYVYIVVRDSYAETVQPQCN